MFFFFLFSFFSFFFLFHRQPKKPRFPQDALPNRTPQQASSHHSQQIYKTHRFTLQCDTLRALDHRELHAVARKKTSPTTSLMLPHKFLKMITPLTFLLYFLPRLFTTPIFHIICSPTLTAYLYKRPNPVSAQPPPSMLVPPLFLIDQQPVFSKISPPICYVPKFPSNYTLSKH